jgi:hypothetical protein
MIKKDLWDHCPQDLVEFELTLKIVGDFSEGPL